jgi:hypothetical protein
MRKVVQEGAHGGLIASALNVLYPLTPAFFSAAEMRSQLQIPQSTTRNFLLYSSKYIP